MSFDKEDSTTQRSLPAEIVPLQRASNMDSRIPSGDNGPAKHHQHQHHQHQHQDSSNVDNPDLYPGFGRLFAQHMNSMPPRYGDARAEPFRENAKGGSELYAPNKIYQDAAVHRYDEDDRKQEAVKSPESRKRRRRLSESDPHSSDDDDDDDDEHHQHKRHERNFVHHEYHDYSGLSGGPIVLPALAKKGRGGVSSMFPTVLHHMLEDAEKLDFAHIVSWMPHGRAFHVHLPDKFVTDIMPKYFRHTRLSSFQRQLSLYGFTRLARKGPDRGAYYHECFLRGMMHLCSNMQRTRVKGTMVRQSSSPETEPDFSSMPPVGANQRSTHQQLLLATNYAASPSSVEESPTYSRNAAVAPPNQPSAVSKVMPMPPLVGNNNNLGNSSSSRNNPQGKFGAPRTEDHSEQSALKLQPQVHGETNAQFRPWGTKFMRHLLSRVNTTNDQQRKGVPGKKSLDQGRKSPQSSQGSNASGQDDGSSSNCAELKKPAKVDADLAVFLESVDLESDNDECLESEEAMARILEQDVSQISEV